LTTQISNINKNEQITLLLLSTISILIAHAQKTVAKIEFKDEF